MSSVLSGVLPALTPVGLGALFLLAAIIWAIVLAFTGKKRRQTNVAVATSYPGVGGQQFGGAPPVGPVSNSQFSPPVVASQPPGWYPDPNDPQVQRWWNGTEWSTETFRP